MFYNRKWDHPRGEQKLQPDWGRLHEKSQTLGVCRSRGVEGEAGPTDTLLLVCVLLGVSQGADLWGHRRVESGWRPPTHTSSAPDQLTEVLGSSKGLPMSVKTSSFTFQGRDSRGV